MAINFKFPTKKELDLVTAKWQGMAPEQMVGAQILPFVNEDSYIVEWDELSDLQNMIPPMAPRDNTPPHDIDPGSVTKRFVPDIYAQFEPIEQEKVLRARQLGTIAGTVDLTTLIVRVANRRLRKTHTRAEWLRWNALLGSVAIDENGVKKTYTFAVQTYSAGTPWSTVATATPLADFDAVALLFAGTGATPEGAKAYMNRKTANSLLQNVNSQDLHGLQRAATTVTLGRDEVNVVLEGRGLPTVVVYDGGYKTGGTYTRFIPDNKVIVVGQRAPGEMVGDFVLTPTLHNMVDNVPQSGIWTKQVIKFENEEIPYISVGSGFTGGPRMFFEDSIVVMMV